MLIACWSVKGGSGTTVVAASLALVLARRPGGALLVDLAGDAAAALALPPTPAPSVARFDADGPSALMDAATDAGPGLRLLRLPAASPTQPDGLDGAGAERLAGVLDRHEPVVVDCGSSPTPAGVALASMAAVSLLVLRPCYLALRRALDAPIRPSALVVVEEPGRALCGHDVAQVLGVPVRATVPWDPRVGRSVDAGLLAARLPRSLAASLRRAA